jgi:Tfp pilus assembly protein PilN
MKPSGDRPALLAIDLLPERRRETRGVAVREISRIPLVWLTGGVLVAYTAWSAGAVRFARRRLHDARARIEQLRPLKQEVDRLQQAVQRLHAEEEAFRAIGETGPGWSSRLNALSDLTPDGVWFTEFVMDRAIGLQIQGTAIAQGGAEMVRIGQLVNDLKAPAAFASLIKSVQIESIRRAQDHEVELVQFALVCELDPTQR